MTRYRFARGHVCGADELPQWIGPELLGDGRRMERWNADAADAYARAAVERVRAHGDEGYTADAEAYCLDQPDPFRAAALASLIALHAAKAADGGDGVAREHGAQVAFFQDWVLS